MGLTKTLGQMSLRPQRTCALLSDLYSRKNIAKDANTSICKKVNFEKRIEMKQIRYLSMKHFDHRIPGVMIAHRPRTQIMFNPIVIHSCQYHAVSTCRYKQGNCHSVLSAPAVMTINHIDQKKFSMAWLDSLAITQAGWFRGLAESKLVETLMGGLQGIHDSLHLPWWGTIIVSTVLMRGLLTFPLAVYQNYIFAKVESLKPEMDELVKELKRETAIAIKKFGWSEKHARIMFNKSAKKMWKELIVRENCHPFKASLLLWVQIPLWISMSMSFRNMASMMPREDAAAQVLFLEMSTGGFGWIPNLTEVDHSLILPVAMGILNLAITEVNVLSRLQESSKMQKIATNLFRGVSILMIPIASTVPSCVALYWVTSSACGLVQNLALMHPGLRHMCGIPYTPSQRENPYQHLWTQMQKRFSRKKELKN